MTVPKVYLEYLNLIILLWNYPVWNEWNTSHKMYIAAVFATTISNTNYVYSMYIFMTKPNVLENYNNLLQAHIYKTIVNGVSSHLTAYAVYLRQYDTYGFLFFVSFMNHFMVSYLYYFGDLMYDHEYAVVMKQIPHIIDAVIMLGCTEDAELQMCLCIANVFMLLCIYSKQNFMYKFFSAVETYSICKIIHTQ